jgi:hypothetical protein
MYRLGFSISYLLWHYTYGLGELINTVKNFIWAEYRLFSIPIMLKTLFSPWHRLTEGYVKTLDIGQIFGAFIVNTLMRIVGFIARLSILVIGLAVILLTVVLGCILLGIWIFMPVIAFTLFVHGILVLFK